MKTLHPYSLILEACLVYSCLWPIVGIAALYPPMSLIEKLMPMPRLANVKINTMSLDVQFDTATDNNQITPEATVMTKTVTATTPIEKFTTVIEKTIPEELTTTTGKQTTTTAKELTTTGKQTTTTAKELTTTTGKQTTTTKEQTTTKYVQFPNDPCIVYADDQIPKPFLMLNRSMTLGELELYDGVRNKNVAIAYKGKIYDMSCKRDEFLPGGKLHSFGGKDVTKNPDFGLRLFNPPIPPFTTVHYTSPDHPRGKFPVITDSITYTTSIPKECSNEVVSTINGSSKPNSVNNCVNNTEKVGSAGSDNVENNDNTNHDDSGNSNSNDDDDEDDDELIEASEESIEEP